MIFLDARDHVAIVAFNGDDAEVLGGGNELVPAATGAKEALVDAQSGVDSSSCSPNVMIAMGKAFD